MGRWLTCSDSCSTEVLAPLHPCFGGSLPLKGTRDRKGVEKRERGRKKRIRDEGRGRSQDGKERERGRAGGRAGGKEAERGGRRVGRVCACAYLGVFGVYKDWLPQASNTGFVSQKD